MGGPISSVQSRHDTCICGTHDDGNHYVLGRASHNCATPPRIHSFFAPVICIDLTHGLITLGSIDTIWPNLQPRVLQFRWQFGISRGQYFGNSSDIRTKLQLQKFEMLEIGAWRNCARRAQLRHAAFCRCSDRVDATVAPVGRQIANKIGKFRRHCRAAVGQSTTQFVKISWA